MCSPKVLESDEISDDEEDIDDGTSDDFDESHENDDLDDAIEKDDIDDAIEEDNFDDAIEEDDFDDTSGDNDFDKYLDDDVDDVDVASEKRNTSSERRESSWS